MEVRETAKFRELWSAGGLCIDKIQKEGAGIEKTGTHLWGSEWYPHTPTIGQHQAELKALSFVCESFGSTVSVRIVCCSL